MAPVGKTRGLSERLQWRDGDSTTRQDAVAWARIDVRLLLRCHRIDPVLGPAK